jgi:membrane-associated phospholipid phosphatase
VAALVVLMCGSGSWPAFLLAVLVGYSRVYMGAHFPLDTLVGAVMGGGITFAVWHGLAKITRTGSGTDSLDSSRTGASQKDAPLR